MTNFKFLNVAKTCLGSSVGSSSVKFSICSVSLSSGEAQLNYELSPSQKEFQNLARKFAREEMLPQAAEFDRTMALPWDLVKKAWSIGLTNYFVPQEFGGLGLGCTEACIMKDELSYACSILVGSAYVWVKSSGGEAVKDTFPAGKTDDCLLYIGRAEFEGKMMPGRVYLEGEFKGMWLPYEGDEVEFAEASETGAYEILVAKNPKDVEEAKKYLQNVELGGSDVDEQAEEELAPVVQQSTSKMGAKKQQSTANKQGTNQKTGNKTKTTAGKKK